MLNIVYLGQGLRERHGSFLGIRDSNLSSEERFQTVFSCRFNDLSDLKANSEFGFDDWIMDAKRTFKTDLTVG
jgi:hypothetical protein